MVIKLNVNEPAAKRAIKWFDKTFQDPSDETFERIFSCKLVADGNDFVLKFTEERNYIWFMLQWNHPIHHIVSPITVMKQALAGHTSGASETVEEPSKPRRDGRVKDFSTLKKKKTQSFSH